MKGDVNSEKVQLGANGHSDKVLGMVSDEKRLQNCDKDSDSHSDLNSGQHDYSQ